MNAPRGPDFPAPPNDALRFEPVLQRLSFDQQATIKSAMKKDNPKAGADFLTKHQGKQVIPLVFSCLIANDQPIASKMTLLSNIQGALALPSSSGLSQKISVKPNDFFDNLVKICAREDLGYIPSPESKQYLGQIHSNFKTEIEKYEYKTLTGRNLDIFKTGGQLRDPKHLLESVITGVLDEKLPPELRQTLAKALIFAGNNPDFLNNEVFASDASYQNNKMETLVPEILGSKPKDILSQLHDAKQELTDTKEAAGRTEESLRKKLLEKEEELAKGEERIKRLWDLLLKTRARHSSGEITGEHKDPFIVLDIPPAATEAEIKKAWKRLSNLYHPDLVWGLFEKGKVTDDPKARALRILAQEKLKEINDAYDDLKLQGKVH